MRKGAAELVVLSVLSRGEAYGVEILDAAQAAGDLVAEGAIYQLLNRLEREGKLKSRWDTDGSAGHPRRYYSLTDDGRALFRQMSQVWKAFAGAMSAVVEKGQ